MTKILKRTYVPLGFILLAAIMIPKIVPSPYLLHLINVCFIYTIAALGLNILMGYTGIFSLGHMGFFAVGGFTSAVLTMHYGLSVWISIPISSITAAASSFFIALPILRIKRVYLIITTIAFGEIIRGLTNILFTSGGLPGIPRPAPFLLHFVKITFDSEATFYHLLLLFLLFSFTIVYKIVRSPLGLNFIAIREDDLLAECLAIDTRKYKLISFFISAFFTGLAGTLYAHYVTIIHPDIASTLSSILLLAMVIIGGSGSLIGPIIGTALFITAPEFLHGFEFYRTGIFGVLLILVLLIIPGGLFSLLTQVYNMYIKERLLKLYGTHETSRSS